MHELKRLNELPHDLTVNEGNEEESKSNIVFVKGGNEDGSEEEESGSENSFNSEEDIDYI